MNTYGARRRSRRRRILLQGGDPAEEEAEDAAAATAREAQRESILDIVGAAQASVLVSDSSLQRMAASTARVMQAPEEVAAASQDKAYAILEGVVASAASADYDAALTPLTTSEVGHALSGLVTAGVLSALPSAAPNPASRGLHTLRGMAATLAMNMVNGEDPTTMASDVLTMRVQQEDLGDPASRAFGAPLDTPGGLSSVSFPESLGSAIGSGSTTITLLTSAVDPHLNLTGNDTAAAALRRSLLEASLSGPVGEEVSVSSLAGGLLAGVVGARPSRASNPSAIHQGLAYRGNAGALEIPRGSALSTSDMTALSTDDLAESTTLLAVLAGLMLGAVLLAWLSNLVHEMEKKSILRNLMKHHGTDALWFKQVGDTWTWSLAEEEELQDIAGYNAILQPHSRRAQSLALQPDEEEAPKRLFPPASTIMKTLSAKITAPGSPSTRHLQEASMGGSEGDPREQWPVADHSMSLHTHNLILPIWVPQVDVAAGQTSQASHSLSDFTSLSLGVSQLAGQPTRSAGGLGKEPRASQRVEPAWRARSHRLEPLAQDSARQVRSGQLPATLEMEARAPSVSQPVVEAFTMPPQTMPGGLEDPRCSSPLESEASPTRPLLGGKLSDALASPEVARKQLQRVAQRLKVLVRAVVSKEKLKDFSTSEELCAVLGVNFTKLMLCLPVAHMKKRARAAQQKRASQLFLGTIGAGKSGKVLPGQAAVEAAPQNKWKFKKKKLRNLLSLERMLGTALVHAFMDINQLLTDTLQQTHIASACNLPWSTPPGRDFGWFTEVFKELITACQGGRWYHYSQLFQMVFLQERDAGFRPTQALANVLRVGCPSSSLADSPMVDFEVEGLHRSLPKEVERQLDTDDEAEVMSVWATALALELYEGLPFSWAMDPQCKPTERVSLGDTILRNLQERPSVGKTMLPTLRAVAARQVAQWQEAHLGSLAALRQRAESDKWKLQGTAGISREGLLARIGKWTYGSALFILTSHPLVAIYRVKSTEAFSRAERLFVQINVFIVMLSCTMAFYYSRDLLTSARSVEFPEELAAADFTCTAFPQNTWTDRIWMALCINAVVIPINVLLMALFLNSGSSGIPGHAGYKVSKAMEQLVGPKRGAVLMSLFTFLYAIFFDFKMLTKAMAMAFMAFFSMLFKPVATVSKALWAATWRMVPMAARKRIERMTPRNSPFIDPLVKHDIQIQGMIDNIVDKIAYCLLAVFWGMTVWILLTYGMLIRQTMGAEAERELIKTWGMVLLSEQFGLGALKLMLARSAGLFVNQQYGQLVAGKDANDILQWYGQYILNFPLSYMPSDADALFASVVM
eukprot:gene8623-10234_t